MIRLANAPAQPRRAHAPAEPGSHVPPAGGCSGLLARVLIFRCRGSVPIASTYRLYAARRFHAASTCTMVVTKRGAMMVGDKNMAQTSHMGT